MWSLATSLTFWVASYPTLVLARGLVGVGEASFGTLAPAYLADILPLSRRARALGLFYLASRWARPWPSWWGAWWAATGAGARPFSWRACRAWPWPHWFTVSVRSGPNRRRLSPLLPGGVPWRRPGISSRSILRRVTLGDRMVTFALGGWPYGCLSICMR